jgi:galactokinase
MRLAEKAGGAEFWVRAPGRVNLIGEHTDYTGGLVLPVALDLEIRGVVRVRRDSRVRVCSVALEGTDEFDIGAEDAGRGPEFGRYVRGVLAALGRSRFGGREWSGFDLILESTLPVAAGLSSSAALEGATAMATIAVNGIDPSPEELVRACHWAENEFVGLACGVMDQSICIHGQTGHAMLLDCGDGGRRQIPLGNLAIVVADTGSERRLSSSAYNRRRSQCEQGLARLAEASPGLTSLRQVDPDMLERHRAELPPLIYRRLRHVVGENRRVEVMAGALAAGDRPVMGEAMAASHRSLRDDFEVSSAELDAMVESAHDAPGLIGSRLTGAGFGGCTVSLVEPDRTAEFGAALAEGYRRRCGREARVYACRSAAGAGWGRLHGN